MLDRTSDIPADQPLSDAAAGFAKDMLRSYVDRIRRLHEERKAIANDISEVFQEAKGNGFDPKALKATIKILDADQNALREHEAIVDLYLDALGFER